SAPACVWTGCAWPGSKQFRPTSSRSDRKHSILVIVAAATAAREGTCCSRSCGSMGDSWLDTDDTVTDRPGGGEAGRAGGGATRIERDPLGELPVPAAALTHKATGRLDARRADAIVRAADEVLAGRHRDQFVVDPYQAGAGTSHNMNCNEVLANRANELLGGRRGAYEPVHPNDHVNMAQSTNDVIPTAIRLAALAQLPALLDAMDRLARAFLAKGRAFDPIVKAGRTHLQDATPIRLGQEFAA